MSLPIGLRLSIDADTRRLDDACVFGGSPARVLRLSVVGQRAYTEVTGGLITTAAGSTLARKLIDAGLAHPVPEQGAERLDVTVVVPARDRPALLRRCLGALGDRYPVLVVDDGSVDAAAVAAVATAFGATLVVRKSNGGPAAARNTALAHVSSELVAFLDSDCVPTADWIDRLAAQFLDPLAVAVAPRILALPSSRAAGRYARAAGSLDLGARPARVVPGGRVSYVPTAALVTKRSALEGIARHGVVFDESLRYGEDVDLIWRLHEAGGRVRYDPTVVVSHHEPEQWSAYLSRRFHYGTSAAPLARRHPGAVNPLMLYPWPALTVAGALARRPLIAAAGLAGGVLAMTRVLRRAGIPTAGVIPAAVHASTQTGLGVARYATQFASPVLLAALYNGFGGSGRRRWGRRTAGAVLLAAPVVSSLRSRRPAMNPFAFATASVADDIAYGVGVWAGAVRARDLSAVLPRWQRRQVRVDPATVPSPPAAASRTEPAMTKHPTYSRGK